MAACVLPTPVAAQDADAARGARIYTPADLARYAPQTALDMVRRIPGFSLESGDQGSRGLGQASQNVLVNGQRISGKTNDAISTLSRIDADQVVRIEILDGATLDVPGLSGEVANVVYEGGGVSGTWRYQATLRERIADNFIDGSATLSGGDVAERWSLAAETNRRRQGNFGPELLFSPDGTLLVSREEVARYDSFRPRVSGSYTRRFADGSDLSLSGAGGLGVQRNRTDGTIAPVEGDALNERFEGSEDEWNLEVGADYAFDLGAGRLKLIGLQRFEHSPTSDLFGVIGADFARFERVVDESESIARGEYGWATGGADWGLSLEGAFNQLDSEGVFIDLPVDGPEMATDFAPNTIAEQRAEAIVSFSRPLGPRVSLQANAGGEVSRIVADGGEARTYANPKGSAALSWRASDRLTVDASVERVVDQLNFFDFLATVDIQNDADRARNDAIRPPTRWVGRVQGIVKLGAWGSVTPFLAGQRIEGIIEAIPIDDDREALGNAGNATRWSAGGEGTLLLAPLGLPGARLDFDVSFGDSRFVDPLLLTPRALGGQTYSRFNFDFRHDLPGTAIAYGGSFYAEDEEGNYRLDQFTNRFNAGPRVSIFAEHKNLWRGMQANLEISNLLQTNDRFDRIAYVDRRDGPIAFIERQDRAFGRVVRFTLSGSF
ncbi:TonB-dependent receptor [Sphingomicrobium sp. XHP0235]|uniref:TonB-dependent receptor n=1 Tax=Sphingomicrobium aquimarinum TaxID=3133971 RepID=UPI0031FE5BB4